jgi:hypothetical protein
MANNYDDVNDRPVERRKKRDWISRCVPILAVIGWLSAALTLHFIYMAQPRGENVYTSLVRNAEFTVSFLNVGMLRLAGGFLVFSLFVCVVGTLLNITRKRRKTDRFNKFIIILGAASLFGIVAYIISYGSLLF